MSTQTHQSIEDRLQHLEDRAAVIDVVVRFAAAMDAADWGAYAQLFTDTVHVDFSDAGLPVSDFARDDFVAFASRNLDTWDARQHLSTNHRVTLRTSTAAGAPAVDETVDTAVVSSYLYAQHHRADQPIFLMHGSYEHHLVRTAVGWLITGLVQHVTWMDAAPSELGA
ncbi:nuclear transport factor 2 family protein [Kineococcus sp. SYSU DK005]|uniref:nuclear transport factor 2 family protein n=1 Tax=Kineococcus sp. SYSU DK005 TaxID=3383126 RepID=UPI003D7CEADE